MMDDERKRPVQTPVQSSNYRAFSGNPVNKKVERGQQPYEDCVGQTRHQHHFGRPVVMVARTCGQ